jgi:hypothetical protein
MFSVLKNHQPTHHDSPQKRHHFTTKNHTETATFSKTPTKNARKTKAIGICGRPKLFR